MITRTGTIAIGSDGITVLKRTSDFAPGLFIYGAGIPINSAILTVDTAVKITMNKVATLAGAKSLEFTTAVVGTYHERNCILTDIKNNIDERGHLIQFIYRDESKVTRDIYNSVKKRTQTTKIFMRSYPVEYSPSIKRLEKLGIKEDVDVVIWTAMKDWITEGIDFKDIIVDTRSTIKIDGDTFEIKQKSLNTQVNDTYGYIIFGLSKR